MGRKEEWRRRPLKERGRAKEGVGEEKEGDLVEQKAGPAARKEAAAEQQAMAAPAVEVSRRRRLVEGEGE